MRLCEGWQRWKIPEGKTFDKNRVYKSARVTTDTWRARKWVTDAADKMIRVR